MKTLALLLLAAFAVPAAAAPEDITKEIQRLMDADPGYKQLKMKQGREFDALMAGQKKGVENQAAKQGKTKEAVVAEIKDKLAKAQQDLRDKHVAERKKWLDDNQARLERAYKFGK